MPRSRSFEPLNRPRSEPRLPHDAFRPAASRIRARSSDRQRARPLGAGSRRQRRGHAPEGWPRGDPRPHPIAGGCVAADPRYGRARSIASSWAGGDGTINAAASGLVDTGLPLGILPLGTANDLARTLGLPLTLDGAIQVAATGRPRVIDLGEVQRLPLLQCRRASASGVDLTRALTGDAKRRWGPIGYAIAGLRVLRRMRPFHVEITIGDRRTMSRTVHLAVGNRASLRRGV